MKDGNIEIGKVFWDARLEFFVFATASKRVPAINLAEDCASGMVSAHFPNGIGEKQTPMSIVEWHKKTSKSSPPSNWKRPSKAPTAKNSKTAKKSMRTTTQSMKIAKKGNKERKSSAKKLMYSNIYHRTLKQLSRGKTLGKEHMDKMKAKARKEANKACEKM